MDFYCIHCKQQTESSDITCQKTKKGDRTFSKATCVTCGKVKSTFKNFSQTGEGKKKTIKFEGEQHVHGNFVGPNTNLKKRMELMEIGESLPIDDIDKSALKHDKNYAILRRQKKAGISKKELLDNTRKVDNTFLKEIEKANANIAKKTAIKSAFLAKKGIETLTKSPLYVGKDNGRDPTMEQLPDMQIASGRKKKKGKGRGEIYKTRPIIEEYNNYRKM